MFRLQVDLLGSCRVARIASGEKVAFNTRKARCLPGHLLLSPGCPMSREQLASALGFLRNAPAWLCILCESILRENGERVGATASHIIADTLVGRIRPNPGSFLNQERGGWHSRGSVPGGAEGRGLTTLRKLLLFAAR